MLGGPEGIGNNNENPLVPPVEKPIKVGDRKHHDPPERKEHPPKTSKEAAKGDTYEPSEPTVDFPTYGEDGKINNQ